MMSYPVPTAADTREKEHSHGWSPEVAKERIWKMTTTTLDGLGAASRRQAEDDKLDLPLPVQLPLETCHQRQQDFAPKWFDEPPQWLLHARSCSDNLGTCIVDHMSWRMQSTDSKASNSCE